MGLTDEQRLTEALHALAKANSDGIPATEQVDGKRPRALVPLNRLAALERLESRGLARFVQDTYVGESRRVTTTFFITDAGWNALRFENLDRVIDREEIFSA